MSKVLILANYDVGLYNFRFEIMERFLKEKHEVHICLPYGKRVDDFINMGVVFHPVELERHGMNPLDELKLLRFYKRLMKELCPDIVFGYTIKPNIYGAMAANKYKIPFVANITGLGTAVENPGFAQKILIALYRYSFQKVKKVYFQNEESLQFFKDKKIKMLSYDILPGSGVNLSKFAYKVYPKDKTIKFAFISRIMAEKGIDQYLDAAEYIKNRYDNVEFHICGFCEKEYTGKLDELCAKNVVIYHGMIQDMPSFIEGMHAIIHPTYYPEGMSNVLLEACASGRPIITTNRSGCREIVEDGMNGYMIPQKNSSALIEAIERFLSLSFEQKKVMGLKARQKVEKEFDRNIVVSKYKEEVDSIGK